LPRQVAQMARTIVGAEVLPADLLDQIVAHTNGVPLFVEEVIKFVLASQRPHGQAEEASAFRSPPSRWGAHTLPTGCPAIPRSQPIGKCVGAGPGTHGGWRTRCCRGCPASATASRGLPAACPVVSWHASRGCAGATGESSAQGHGRGAGWRWGVVAREKSLYFSYTLSQGEGMRSYHLPKPSGREGWKAVHRKGLWQA
jgi:hypothetical protein